MTEHHRLHVSAAQLRPLLPLLALILLGLALWLAWSGFQQSRDTQRDQALQQARDQVAQGTVRALKQQAERLQQGLATPAVQSALASGQLDAAASQRKGALEGADRVEFLPTDFVQAYARLP